MDTILKNERKLLAEGDSRLVSAIKALKRKGPVCLFGAGDLGRKMRRFFEKQGIRVIFFTDNDKNKWGMTIEGLPVLSPHDAVQRDAFFVACSGDALIMAEQLRRLGISQCDVTLHLACQTIFHLRKPFQRHRKELATLYALLSDDKSRTTLKHLVTHAYTLEETLISAIQDSAQYFFSEAFAIHKGETVVDAGAYTGDTVRDMVARFGAVFKKVHCFEPNAKNFACLREYVRRAGLGGKVIPHHFGLSNKKESLHFLGFGLGFHMSAQPGKAGETVRVDTIDNLFARRSPQRIDFIKMDIEGAEPLALEGAAQVITRDRPRLAICVYHSPEHLWTIPFAIKRIVPEYRLFLRHHSANARETVVYATL